MFLPTVSEGIPDPKKITVLDCEFRRRLAPDDAEDQWWQYGSSAVDAAASVAHLVAALG